MTDKGKTRYKILNVFLNQYQTACIGLLTINNTRLEKENCELINHNERVEKLLALEKKELSVIQKVVVNQDWRLATLEDKLDACNHTMKKDVKTVHSLTKTNLKLQEKIDELEKNQVGFNLF